MGLLKLQIWESLFYINVSKCPVENPNLLSRMAWGISNRKKLHELIDIHAVKAAILFQPGLYIIGFRCVYPELYSKLRQIELQS